MFGWSADEAIGTIIRNLKFVHEDDIAGANIKLDGLRQRKFNSYSHQNRNYSKTGDLLHCIWHVSAIVDEEGNIESMFGLVEDVTARVIARTQLQEYQNKLEYLVEKRTRELRDAQDELLRKERLAALGKLTGTVGHELRNPLGTIRTSLHVIKDQLKDIQPGLSRAFGRVDRNINRCDKIISELLDYTRTPKLDRIKTNIDELLEIVTGEYEFPVGIKVSTKFESGVEMKVDADRLTQCVINLVNNAVDAVQDASVEPPRKVNISSKTENDCLQIAVTDTGVGINKEDLDKITEPLFSKKPFGTGLGLSIVKQIIEEHHGGIEVSSEVGVGTMILLWLPLS